MKSSYSYAVISLWCAAASLSGCATTQPYDYTAYRQSRPRSILVLPPVNATNAVEASYSLYSQVTLPLAESGYYVLPVTLVDETFRQNGLFSPDEMAQVPAAKLYQIFKADAALYIRITKYGTVYKIINSESVVTAEGKLVDLRSGALLWEGSASASSAENRNNNAGGGLAGLLVSAVVNQILEQTTDSSHNVAGIASSRLLAAHAPAGMLYGPRSPRYEPSNPDTPPMTATVIPTAAPSDTMTASSQPAISSPVEISGEHSSAPKSAPAINSAHVLTAAVLLRMSPVAQATGARRLEAGTSISMISQLTNAQGQVWWYVAVNGRNGWIAAHELHP